MKIISKSTIGCEAYPTNHASSLLLRDGELLCAWYAGSYECSDDSVILLSKSHDGGKSWSKPKPLIRATPNSVGNPVLSLIKNRLFLFFVVVEGDWWTYSKPYYTFLEGELWSEPCKIADKHGLMLRNKPMIKDSLVILPLYDERLMKPVLYISEDYGISWKPWLVLDLEGAIQPALVEVDEGILVIMRSTIKKRIIFSLIKDDGKISTYTLDYMPNPNSSIDAIKMHDGTLLLAYNDNSEQRTPLSLAISEDGYSWEKLGNVEEGVGEFSYPSLAEDLTQHLIHLSYTCRPGLPPMEDFRYHAVGARIVHAKLKLDGA